jgi:hypothetical protein
MNITLIEPKKPTVIIGSKFTGPNSHHDTIAGTFWAVMPKFSANEERIQRGLINHRKMIDKKEAKLLKEGGYLDEVQIMDLKNERIS